MLSTGSVTQAYRVGIADERYEIYMPDKMGALCDVVSGANKAYSIELLTRTMSPEVLICDELCEADSAPLQSALNGGVAIIATSHAANLEEALRRPFICDMYSKGMFPLIVRLFRKENLFGHELIYVC